MYEKIQDIDAIVLSTGKVHFGSLKNMEEKNYAISLTSKLMGQVNVFLAGLNRINDNGCLP